MQITQLHYSNTNTYLIESDETSLLFDTGWAGTFLAFCKELGEHGKKLQDIDYILISHFHPDHMGIVGEIATYGPV
ncbi:MAG: MBL fold metallo-hydrolase, partial [Lachnospiraceae bacterium]|nr:MBL fold metallo-hydrolase [Lachnospiraceae bacterium]